MLRLLHDGNYAMLVEQTPTTRTITVNKKRYRLPFPYMLFALSTQKNKENDSGCHFYAFGSTKPIKSRDDEVFLLPLPNTYSTGVICLNWTIDTKEFTDAEQCEWNMRKYINLFWNSPYETGGVSVGDKRWEALKDYWTQKTFNPHNINDWCFAGGTRITNPYSVQKYFHQSTLQEPLDPRFTDDIVREFASQIKQQEYWRPDEQCWLLAEQAVAYNISCQ